MSKKIWNLMYVAGNPAMFSQVFANADNPCTRKDALEGANTIANNGGGWRLWVEHNDTGERIFESPAEIEFRQAQGAAKTSSKGTSTTKTCGECGGYGQVFCGDTPHTETCPVCGGLGHVDIAAEAPVSLA